MDPIERQLAEKDLPVERRTLDILQQLENRGTLTVGWPQRPCVQDSLVWIPSRHTSVGRTTSIVSSRLGRELDRLDPIFGVFRAAISQLDPQQQCLLSVAGTTMHRYVTRASELFRVPLRKVVTPRSSTPLHRWAKSCLDLIDGSEANLETPCFVSNPLGERRAEYPLPDEIEVLGSNQLLVLHARKNGNLHALLQDRLRHESNTRTFVAIGDDKLVSEGLRNELMDQGAVGWFPAGLEEGALPRPVGNQSAPVLDRLENQDRYLIHCTRRAKGAWPDQADHEFLDELILGAASRDRSCFAALTRIVRMRRLLGTNDAIRDKTSVVSFTGAQLDELSSMRTFRSHRGRWDFEPYGLAIDRRALVAVGAREVIYGDDATWDAMSADDRPLFQRVDQALGAIDWSVEKEWRVIGDVDLSVLSSENAIVFVPTRDEAEQLAQVSKWPVVALNT